MPYHQHTFNISNEDELTQALEDSVFQIQLQIQNLEGSTSKFYQ